MPFDVTIEGRKPFVSGKDPLSREAMATLVFKTINAGNFFTSFKPYRPNDWTDTGWVVDPGNDWRVFFSDEFPNRMTISHRYNAAEAATGLAHWIAYRIGATVRSLDASTIG
jgi:hypothetical protein